MKPLIPPVPREKLKAELKKDIFLRKTNNGNNEVYVFDWRDSELLLQEVGRLREETFRAAGGGTGKDCDLDEYDTNADPYTQLIVWDPDNEDIIGGYRYYFQDVKEKYNLEFLATRHYFHFSDECIRDYWPHMMELGRSFVQPKYQITSAGRKGLFALDNLWDGLGAVVIDNPRIQYFFGKVTMYPHFNEHARNMIQFFLQKHFKDQDRLIWPVEPFEPHYPKAEMEALFTGKDYSEDYKILQKEVRKLGENIPPLINAYMNLSPTMRIFGTIINRDFGHVEETGIMITLRDLYINKVTRHLESYRKDFQLPGQPDQQDQ